MSDLTLKQIRSVIPAQCFEVSGRRSGMTFLRIIALLSLCLYFESRTENLLVLSLLWLIHGQIIVGLFVLGHDCGHNTFAKTKWLNNLFGYICMSPLGNGLMTWKLTHDHHHAHTQKRGQEVDWSKRLLTKEEFSETRSFVTKLGYQLPFGIFFWVFHNAIHRGFNKTAILNRELSPKEARAVSLSNLIMLLSMTSLYAILWYKFGFFAMWKYHGIPATIAMITGYYLLIIQHANEQSHWYDEDSWTPVKGQMSSTFDVRFPRILEWLWLDINIHVPHHVSPNIPWYHLREAGAAIKKNFPHLYNERRFSFKEISWMIRTPYLIRVKNTFSIQSWP